MINTRPDFINKIHLIISVLIVVPVAFIYGFNPESQFDISITRSSTKEMKLSFEIFADVETMGLPVCSINHWQNGSEVMRIPMEPSSDNRFGAIFFALG